MRHIFSLIYSVWSFLTVVSLPAVLLICPFLGAFLLAWPTEIPEADWNFFSIALVTIFSNAVMVYPAVTGINTLLFSKNNTSSLAFKIWSASVLIVLPFHCLWVFGRAYIDAIPSVFVFIIIINNIIYSIVSSIAAIKRYRSTFQVSYHSIH